MIDFKKGYSPAVQSERSFGKASLILLSFRETMETDAPGLGQFIKQVSGFNHDWKNHNLDNSWHIPTHNFLKRNKTFG